MSLRAPLTPLLVLLLRLALRSTQSWLKCAEKHSINLGKSHNFKTRAVLRFWRARFSLFVFYFDTVMRKNILKRNHKTLYSKTSKQIGMGTSGGGRALQTSLITDQLLHLGDR